MKQKRTRIDRNIDIDEHGKYHISLYYGYENGKYKRKSVTCTTKEEAINIRDKHECDVRFYGKASTNTKITVAECIEQYIEEKPLEETTKGGYRTRLKRISKYPLGKKSMVSVKKIDIDRYLDGLQKGTPLINKTINGDRQLLQAVFNYAMECEYISKNVTIGVKKKQEDKYQAKTLPISHKRGAFGNTGVVDQNLYTAIDSADILERLANRLQAGQMRTDAGNNGIRIFFFQLGYCLICGLLSAGRDDDLGSFGKESVSGGKADASAAAVMIATLSFNFIGIPSIFNLLLQSCFLFDIR